MGVCFANLFKCFVETARCICMYTKYFPACVRLLICTSGTLWLAVDAYLTPQIDQEVVDSSQCPGLPLISPLPSC